MLKFTKTESKKEVNGVWTSFDNGLGDEVEFLIARAGGANDAYSTAIQEKSKPYRKNGKQPTEAQSNRIVINAMAEFLLIDWKPSEFLLSDDGKPAKYSVDDAVELLKQDDDLVLEVLSFAGDMSNFLMKKK